MVWFLRALRIAAALGTSIVRPLPARSRHDSPAETLRAGVHEYVALGRRGGWIHLPRLGFSEMWPIVPARLKHLSAS